MKNKLSANFHKFQLILHKKKPPAYNNYNLFLIYFLCKTFYIKLNTAELYYMFLNLNYSNNSVTRKEHNINDTIVYIFLTHRFYYIIR